ncbi:hypothetical protein [Marinisporobacter balticus]|uniref:Uncharacterized protein n=1 Tax=Marinisporobacter balticus TaxID=2018667 RepID=A0A4R2KLU9_9FIRM|nr:hypothetical protein [Marinisporobacter balticus]TCO75041.1 hypothetical protein EV214_110115 [Marinisporobacter balticus]
MTWDYLNKKLYVLLICLLLLIGGCTETIDGEHSGFGVVTIAPSSLFEGDAKKLEPHLGLTTGCVKVKYKGNKNGMSCKYEVWEKGKLIDVTGSGTYIIDGEYDGEVSISLRERLLDNLEWAPNMVMKTVIMDKRGSAISTKFIDRFDQSYSWGAVPLKETIKFKDDEEVAVWGLFAGDYENKVKIEDMAKTADWALILKVFLKDVE